MMSKKAEVFEAWDILERIKATDNPREVKELGREIPNFSDKIWDKHKINIVRQANFLKFSQNSDLKEIMINHKDLILVEASPVDRVWGIGLHFSSDLVLNEKNWKGKNLLGECIMYARNKIISKV
jgi:ribA/ribD-fused uncharacterized protein